MLVSKAHFCLTRYFKNEDFSNESLSLIELRIKGKYNHVKKSSFKSEDLYKHYKNFLSNIKNLKNLIHRKINLK